MDFNLTIPVKVVSGKNCIKNNAELFKNFGKSCMIVTGKSSAKLSGALDDVTYALKKCDIDYVIFDEITQNPVLQTCHKAGKIATENGAQFIIGIGGGSPLDAAKAIAIFANNETFSADDIYIRNNSNEALPLVLVGTTAGTGSEVGSVAVLTDEVSGRKKSINYSDCNAKLTFADFTYTNALSYEFTVSTALDALSHAFEGYLSSKCTDIPAMFAEKAVALIWEGLKTLHAKHETPSEEIREKLFYGSLYAGITLSNCGTGFPHPLGYILTENRNIPHGKACTAFMRDFINRADEFEHDKLAKLLQIVGEDKLSFCQIVDDLTNLPEIHFSSEELEIIMQRFDTPPNNFKISPNGYTKELAFKAYDKFIK